MHDENKDAIGAPDSGEYAHETAVQGWRKFLKLNSDFKYRYRRVVELFIGAELGLVFTIIVEGMNFSGDRSLLAVGLMVTLLAAVIALHATFHVGREAWTLRVGLWCGLLMLIAAIWADKGVYDSGCEALGIVLIYAAMLETRKQYFAMLATMLLGILLMGVLASAGFLHYEQGFTWSDIVDELTVFAILGYGINALSSDLRSMVTRYEIENEKVRRSEQEISRLVHHDALTGLPNRIILQRDFEDAMADERGRQALLFIDLDNFKAVNDNLGHDTGDRLLKEIADRLRDGAGDEATIGRMGGDEFMLFFPFSDDEEVVTLARRVQAKVSVPMQVGGVSLVPTFSMGIARTPDDGTDFQTLYRNADIALYSAKAAGRNMFKIYDPAMNSQSLAHLGLAGRLKEALHKNELKLYYQPKVSLGTGRIDGAEALLRWFPTAGEPVAPDVFIPIAENTGSIVEIGRWVLMEACRQCRQWQLAGFPDFKVSVNVSTLQFRPRNLGAIVSAALSNAGLKPEYLELELSESALIEDEYDIAGQIHRLVELGVSFSIDDFGKGYSNLGILRKYDIGTLKVDREFVANMFDQGQGGALLEAIISMAHALGLKPVAEGVETEEASRQLQSLGCRSGQGFLWARPLSPEEFDNFICKGQPASKKEAAGASTALEPVLKSLPVAGC